MATKKEEILRETLEEKGYEVKDIWFRGLVGWTAEVITFNEGEPERYDDWVWLGNDLDDALIRIEEDRTDPKLSTVRTAP